jgi:hypothetical protein
MPAQALIRKMDKTAVDKLIATGKFTELLEVEPLPDGVLVRCKAGPGGVGNLPGAHEALQAICDEDSKIVRAEAKGAADKAKAAADKAAADKAAADKAKATAQPPKTPA